MENWKVGGKSKEWQWTWSVARPVTVREQSRDMKQPLSPFFQTSRNIHKVQTRTMRLLSHVSPATWVPPTGPTSTEFLVIFPEIFYVSISLLYMCTHTLKKKDIVHTVVNLTFKLFFKDIPPQKRCCFPEWLHGIPLCGHTQTVPFRMFLMFVSINNAPVTISLSIPTNTVQSV